MFELGKCYLKGMSNYLSRQPRAVPLYGADRHNAAGVGIILPLEIRQSESCCCSSDWLFVAEICHASGT